jgi:hypothetical protein
MHQQSTSEICKYIYYKISKNEIDINLTKHVHNFYEENYRTVMKEIKGRPK